MSESERIKEELASEIDYLRAEITRLTKENHDLEYQLQIAIDDLARERNINNELSWRIDNSRGGY